jgi:transcriptional regulator with XRE-family HTH domain
MNVNNKSTVVTNAEFSLASSIRRVRRSKGMNQGDFAKLFGVSQGAVSNWEMGIDVPTIKYLQQLSTLTSDQSLLEYLEQELAPITGIKSAVTSPGARSEVKRIPVLRDPAVAGTTAATQEKEIREVLELPARWFASTGEFYGLNASGESMAPIVNDGSLIIVDTSKKNPKDLVHRMVAVRDAKGIAVYWLREDDGYFLLAPEVNTHNRTIRILRKDGNWSLIGEVVVMIGIAPRPSRAARK